MIHYTDRLTRLMRDIVPRVPRLGFIDLERVLVFARRGLSSKDGPVATCHSINQPPSEPTHDWWRDRCGRMVKRSEWFVVKSPVVSVGGTRIDYMISVSLPRFCDQTLERSRKRALYALDLAGSPLVAKLDTVIHELYHIDPDRTGIRRLARADGSGSRRFHGPDFYRDVAAMVREYLAQRPEPGVVDFLRYGSRELVGVYDEVQATAFDAFPSFPKPYRERLAQQPLPVGHDSGIEIVEVSPPPRRLEFNECHLRTRRFLPRRRAGLVSRLGVSRSAYAGHPDSVVPSRWS